MVETKCKAKNPAACPYHGQASQINLLKEKINSLLNPNKDLNFDNIYAWQKVYNPIHKELGENVTEDENTGLYLWRGDSHRVINVWLREGTPVDELPEPYRKGMLALDGLFNKKVDVTSRTLYRGVRTLPPELKKTKSWKTFH